MTDIRLGTADLETLTSRRLVLDMIDLDKTFFKSNDQKVDALRACVDLWDHELVEDSKDVKDATHRLILQKLCKLRKGNVLAFPK